MNSRTAIIPSDGQPLRLERAFIRRTVLDGADLTEANLTRADMTGASARGANFKNTILNKTIMRGVDLTGALNITVDQLADALIDDTTILPNYIDRAAVERLQRARRGGLL
ncbi:MAG: pentapeptide repeat-containing protein [Rhodovulum sp.]|nr:pentapeptide repeat-containing protein [Paracoccaceae bacterium]MCC0067371.1 pentapeptide repeat-containing protein [Rhodovulum sp.]